MLCFCSAVQGSRILIPQVQNPRNKMEVATELHMDLFILELIPPYRLA